MSRLATVIALGLVAATAFVVVTKKSKYAAGHRGLQSSTADEQRSAAMDEDELASAAAAAPHAAPLAIPPAPAGSKALIVCKEGSEEATVAEQWASQSRGRGATVSVCPPGYLDSHAKRNTGMYDSIVVETGEALESAALGEVVKLLKAGGKVNVAFGDGDDGSTAVKRNLTFAGFLKVAPCPEDQRVLTGERAAWETGASAPVRVSLAKGNGSQNGLQAANGGGGGASAAAPGKGGPAKKTWKLAMDDDEEAGGADGWLGGGDEEDLVDEDALLESSAPVKRPSKADGAGCATKRRACKDCSCGRAEKEMMDGVNGNGNGTVPASVVSVADVDDALTSSCGNCSKGDAFRCGGCPFLGKPAFEKGQEKTIMLADLEAQQDE